MEERTQYFKHLSDRHFQYCVVLVFVLRGGHWEMISSVRCWDSIGITVQVFELHDYTTKQSQ